MQAPKQILIVDSDDRTRLNIEEEIRKLGHCTEATWSALEAMALLKSRSYDLVLVDDYLPDMYVGNFLESVSSLKLRPRIYVMQAEPAQDICIYGSRLFSVVKKSRTGELLGQLASRACGSFPDPGPWKH